MDLNFALIALYVTSVVSLLVTPGPVTLLVVRTGLAGSMRQVFQTIAGTNAASLVLIFISALLIKGLLVIDERIFSLVRLLGCVYIIWIASAMVKDAWATPATPATSATSAMSAFSQGTPRSGFFRGFTLAISNPKNIVFFASFLPQFVAVLPQPDHSIALLTVLWVLLDFATLGALALLVRRVVRPAQERLLLLLASSLLLLIGTGGLLHAAYLLLA